MALRLRDAERVHNVFKVLTVFCALDGGHIGADNGNAEHFQGFGKIDGGLPAQRHDYAEGIFQRHDIHDVLHGQRLEI